MTHASRLATFSTFRLVEEVYEIRETVEQLQNRLREAENSLQHLLRTKATLEQDLAVKNNSLFIDREKCQGLRKTFPMTPRIATSINWKAPRPVPIG